MRLPKIENRRKMICNKLISESLSETQLFIHTVGLCMYFLNLRDKHIILFRLETRKMFHDLFIHVGVPSVGRAD